MTHILPCNLYAPCCLTLNSVIVLTLSDIILVYCGFTCHKQARMVLAEVKIPPFTRGLKQLEKQDINWSWEFPVVEIQVERVIELLKQKYTML